MFEVMKICFCSSFTWNPGQGCFQANKTKAQTTHFCPALLQRPLMWPANISRYITPTSTNAYHSFLDSSEGFFSPYGANNVERKPQTSEAVCGERPFNVNGYSENGKEKATRPKNDFTSVGSRHAAS